MCVDSARKYLPKRATEYRYTKRARSRVWLNRHAYSRTFENTENHRNCQRSVDLLSATVRDGIHEISNKEKQNRT